MFSIKNSEIRYYYYIIRVWMKEGWRLPPPPHLFKIISCWKPWILLHCNLYLRLWVLDFVLLSNKKMNLSVLFLELWKVSDSCNHECTIHASMHPCICTITFLSSFQALPNPQLDRTGRRLKIYPSNDKGNSKL